MADNFPNAPIYPFGPTSVRKPSVSSGDLSVDPVDNSLIVVENQTNLTGSTTVKLANIEPGLPEGSKVRVKVTADGTGRTVSFGSNITGTSVSVSANKTHVIEIEKLASGWFKVSDEQVN